MNLKDVFDTKNIIGILKVEDITNDKILFEDKNLIVEGAGYLLANFISGNQVSGIKYIAIGDMNLTSNDDLENVRPPACTDYKLDNEVFRKEASIEPFEDDYGYGVRYSIILEKDECNGANGKQLITEYGLLSESVYQNTGNDDKDGKNILFSRKTKSAIFKDYEIRLKITWTIYFKKSCV
jgi:hypothetical protein